MKGTDQEERKRIISRGESEKGLESWKGGGGSESMVKE